MEYIEVSIDLRRMDFHLEIEMSILKGEITGLYGPSGSGKSSLLRLIAGVEPQSNLDRVEISTSDGIWSGENHFLPSHLRGISYVFQEAQLFPHLSVQGNLEYAIQRKQNETDIELSHVKQWLDIEELMHKSVDELSGGEKQRVSIARALLNGAGAMLMDEPLGALDHRAKYRILPYIDQIHKRLDFPFLYVSHAIDELTYLTDKIHVIENGKITDSGSTLALGPKLGIDNPDASAIINCELDHYDKQYHLTCLCFEKQKIYIAGNKSQSGRLKLNIPARDVSITKSFPRDSSILNILQGVVVAIHDSKEGSSELVQVKIGNQTILSRITRLSLDKLKIEIGLTVYVQIKSVSLISEYEN